MLQQNTTVKFNTFFVAKYKNLGIKTDKFHLFLDPNSIYLTDRDHGV